MTEYQVIQCPVCGFEGPLAEVRAHVAVRGRVDDDHENWLHRQGIHLDDDSQASVGEITIALTRQSE